MQVWITSAANRGRLTSTGNSLWLAGWLGRWRNGSDVTEPSAGPASVCFVFPASVFPGGARSLHAVFGKSRATYRGDSRTTHSWRPYTRACHGSWSARTVYTGPTSAGHRTVLTSGRTCGSGMWALSDRRCYDIPRPGASQHRLMEALQTATTWRRSCGLFTIRQKNRLKVFITRDSVYYIIIIIIRRIFSINNNKWVGWFIIGSKLICHSNR